MGPWKHCSALNWEDSKSATEVVYHNAVYQFLRVYKRYADMRKEDLLWGDEIEYILVKMDGTKKVAWTSLRATVLLERLADQKDNEVSGHWMPELGEFQLESIPNEPYSGRLEHLVLVESSMRQRRNHLRGILDDREYALTLTSFPRCGCSGFTEPCKPANANNGLKPTVFPEEALSQCSPRNRAIDANVTARAGEDYAINIPVFQDTHTQLPWIDGIRWPGGKPNHVFFSTFALGMTSSAMHVTFQALNLADAKNMHDQFAVISPIMMALTAGSPITRGYLTDVDSRWPTMEQAGDDRTAHEKEPQHCSDDTTRYQFSRASSPTWFLSKAGMRYNDVQAVYNEATYDHLINEGVDEHMAMHIAIILKRDLLLAFADYAEPRMEDTTDDFDNVITVTWPTVRLKLPYSDGSVGWRVEFRPMGIQVTDFENASFAIFMVLMGRIIRDFDLNFLIPVSKIQENIDRAVIRDAVRTGKLYFRCSSGKEEVDEVESTCMSVNEIINGKAGSFIGIIPIMHRYLDSHLQDTVVRQGLNENLNLVSCIASGERPTQARWIREFVLNHPEYRHDSVVTERIQYDLIEKCLERTHELEGPGHISFSE